MLFIEGGHNGEKGHYQDDTRGIKEATHNQ